MIRGVKFASIPVADQDRALAFYTEVLGFRVITDSPFSDDQRWIELAIGHAETKVVLFTPDEHRDRVGTPAHVTLWSADVKRTYDELKARGVEFLGEPETADWGAAAVFRDSEGNTLVISSR